jgi:hypothetical protein
MADHIGIFSVYHICSFLPLLGLLAAWLPSVGGLKARSQGA